MFFKGEGLLKGKIDDPVIQVLSDLEIEGVILEAFASVSPGDCYGWVKDCGYIID